LLFVYLLPVDCVVIWSSSHCQLLYIQVRVEQALVWPHPVALVDVGIYSWAEAPQSATKTQKHNPISQGSLKHAITLFKTPLKRFNCVVIKNN